jgi:hypothetical protein
VKLCFSGPVLSFLAWQISFQSGFLLIARWQVASDSHRNKILGSNDYKSFQISAAPEIIELQSPNTSHQNDQLNLPNTPGINNDSNLFTLQPCINNSFQKETDNWSLSMHARGNTQGRSVFPTRKQTSEAKFQ